MRVNAIVVVGSGAEARGQNVDKLQRGKNKTFQKRLGKQDILS